MQKKLCDYYDKIFCITLLDVKDRVENIKNVSKQLGVDINCFKAITPDDIKIPKQICCLQNEYACGKSHVAIWEHILDNSYGRCLILEDDVKINPEFNISILHKYRDILLEKSDISFLGLNYRDRSKFKPINNDILKVNYAFALHSYSPSTQFLEKIVKKYYTDNYTGQIDRFMANEYRSCEAYAIHPPMFTQKSGYSYIQKRNINYDRVLK